MIECRRMTFKERDNARAMLLSFLAEDEYYLDSSTAYGAGGEAALETALDLFLKRPELGFVWLAYEGQEPVAACVVCFAISTSLGSVVAKLDDVVVASDKRGHGVGTAHLASLMEELRRIGVGRIDTSVHMQNSAARRFYERHGFQSLNEERLASVL